MLAELLGGLLALAAAPMEPPAGREPLPPIASGPRQISVDFDGDGRVDTAGLFLWRPGNAVELWVNTATGHGLILNMEQADPETLGYVLGLRGGDVEGDPTCPRIVAGRRDCGRPFPLVHRPFLVVRSPDGSEHLWFWNGYGFGRLEVYDQPLRRR